MKNLIIIYSSIKRNALSLASQNYIKIPIRLNYINRLMALVVIFGKTNIKQCI